MLSNHSATMQEKIENLYTSNTYVYLIIHSNMESEINVSFLLQHVINVVRMQVELHHI